MTTINTFPSARSFSLDLEAPLAMPTRSMQVESQTRVVELGYDDRKVLLEGDAIVPDSWQSMHELKFWDWRRRYDAKGGTAYRAKEAIKSEDQALWREKFGQKAARLNVNPSGHIKIDGGWIPIKVPSKLQKGGWSQEDYADYLKKLGVNLPPGSPPAAHVTNDTSTQFRPNKKAKDYQPTYRMSGSITQNLMIGGSKDGFLGAVNALMNTHQARMGMFEGFYDTMVGESKVAKDAASFATEVQRIIASLNSADAKASVSDEIQAFAAKHIGDGYDAEMSKGDLEALRDHLNNVASSKKTDNEKMMLKQNELAAFLTSLITLATNLIKMFNDMRSAVVSNMRS